MRYICASHLLKWGHMYTIIYGIHIAYVATPVGRYKTFFHVEAFVHDSTILSFPAPTWIAHRGAILLHDY